MSPAEVFFVALILYVLFLGLCYLVALGIQRARQKRATRRTLARTLCAHCVCYFHGMQCCDCERHRPCVSVRA